MDAIIYGIAWYIEIGRATAEIEQELKALTGRKFLRLVVRIYLDGVDVSGNVGSWLRSHQGSFSR
ncbi:MAG: hypothetical protein F6K14_26755 [Symploca sp. SIO2C1]|nr:hypothetical protein [Symploca sp. SIO2C1]